MSDPTLRASSVQVWTRLTYRPLTGFESISGDCRGVLGIGPEALSNGPDALSLLPSALADLLRGPGQGSAPVLFLGEGLRGVAARHEDAVEVVLYRADARAGLDEDLLEEVTAGVTLIDSRGICRFWNSAMASMFGIRSEDALGDRFGDFMPEPVLLSWDSVLDSCMRGRHVKVECRPGTETRVEATLVSTGRGVVGTFVDTTDSFRTEKRLRTNRRMSQTYFRNLDTGLVLFGQDYRILLSNPGFGRMLGVSENLMGMPVYEILPRECFAELDALMQAVLSGRSPEKPIRTARYDHPDGSRRTVEITLKPLEGDETEIAYLAGILEDVSELDSAREKLSALKARTELVRGLLERDISEKQPAFDERVAIAALRGCPARAVAVYRYDPFESTYLSASAGEWQIAPGTEFSSLGLPDTVWTSLPSSQLREHETGLLGDSFSLCVVYPIGVGSFTAGFLLVCDPEPVDEETESFCVSLVHLALLEESLRRERSGREQADFLLDKEREFASSLLSGLGVPVAGFTADWRVVLWNQAMEELTGCPAEKALGRPELARDLLFGKAGGLSSARAILAESSRSSGPAVWGVGREAERGSPAREGTSEPALVAWRTFTLDTPELGGVDLVNLLTGVPVETGGVPSGITESLRRMEAFVRGTARVCSAPDPDALARIARETIRLVSGARKVLVELDLTGEAGSTGPAAEPGGDLTVRSLGPSGKPLGRLIMYGGEWTALLDEFCSIVSARLSALAEARLIGSMGSILGGPGSSAFVTNGSGEVLIPPSGGRLFPGLREGVSVASLFPSGEGPLREAMARAVSSGRAIASGLPAGRTERCHHVLVSMDTVQGSGVLFWIPLDELTPALAADIDPGTATRGLESAMAEIVMRTLSEARDDLSELLGLLPPDRVSRAVSGSLMSKQEGALRVADCLWAFLRSQLRMVRKMDAPEVLHEVIDRFVSRGMRPPSLSLEGELPAVEFDEQLLRFALVRLAALCSSEGECVIVARSLHAGSPEVERAVVGTSPVYLGIMLVCDSLLPESTGGRGVLADLGMGFLSPSAELSLLQLLIVLCGGDCMRGGDGRSISIVIPGTSARASSGPSGEGPAGTVLVLDEDVSSRHMIARALGRSGLEAVQASSAAEGLSLVASAGSFDAVFVSRELHGTGGVDFVERLAAASPGSIVCMIEHAALRGADVSAGGTGRESRLSELSLFRPFSFSQAMEAVSRVSSMMRAAREREPEGGQG
ncbi:PAS domain-containing protein [Candidatus Fermentibacterales bacterium]|nr:PAS domain-containing protein [Candidatus Fermentibacterales bacterium]